MTLPDEAGDAGEALWIGDARMYERKRGGRPSAEAQSVATLLRLLSERGHPVDDRGEIAEAVAARLGRPPRERESVRIAAVLHDVGKLAVPDSIVDKPGPLDGEEWEFICRHPLIGERILAATPGLAGAGALVRASHERPDGCGYPTACAATRARRCGSAMRACTSASAAGAPAPRRRASRRCCG